MEELAKKVHETYKGDPTDAGIVVSYVTRDHQWYMCIYRYHQAFAKNRETIIVQKHENFDACLAALASRFEIFWVESKGKPHS